MYVLSEKKMNVFIFSNVKNLSNKRGKYKINYLFIFTFERE